MSTIKAVRAGITRNLGNYESLRLEVEVEADQEHETAEQLFARALAELQAELQRREREVCRSVWVPYAKGEGPNAAS